MAASKNNRIKKTAHGEGMMRTPTNRLLDVHEVAEQLGVSASTLYRWRSTGEHPTPRAIKIGSHVRWRQSDVDTFIESLAEAA